ncbi:hypothetical protein [Pseudomonas sp. ML96]|uniref:hypothetical protein n=1 Tax=Pseudomonas sp. ML96 TaxID=1523503 RepID=UPI0005B8BCD2|nr:hypothetical protein [Pseudomonas sp. ML96]
MSEHNCKQVAAVKVAVPFEPTEAQWGGLARDIVWWMRSYPSNKHTPATLVEHLGNLGREIPAWMGSEVELKRQDHVISKGTIAVLIYKAMLAAGPDPVTPAEVIEAVDWVDDFIARCNGDDRGACQSVNVLRQALSASQPEPDPVVAELVEALGSMTCAYRMAIQAGHARITALGGECDSVEQMLADFPDYTKAVELYKSKRSERATANKQGGGAA